MKYRFEIVIGMEVEIDSPSHEIAKKLAENNWADYVEEAWIVSMRDIGKNEMSLRRQDRMKGFP